MSRELPFRPNLEHLKTQAKDLLEGHRRHDPEALSRISVAFPAYAGLTKEAIAKRPFALHDAQSTIAREYGRASWVELRDAVIAQREAAAQASTQDKPSTAARPDLDAVLQGITGVGGSRPPAEVIEALKSAWSPQPKAAMPSISLPEKLPAIMARDMLPVPGITFPLHLGRSVSMRAIEAAEQGGAKLLAVFAQRAIETASPDMADLVPEGILASVRLYAPAEEGRAWVVLEGIRWIRLLAIDSKDPYYVVQVGDVEVRRDDEARLSELGRKLRSLVRTLAERQPQKEQVLAMIDGIDDIGRLADLVIVNLPVPVAEKAVYAAETDLAKRLEMTIAFAEAEAAKPIAPAAP